MLEKLKKSKNEIQEEIIKNEKLIKIYDRNARILEVNTIENKLQFFLGISCFLYWIPVFIMLIMEFPAVLGLSPFQTFPLVTIGSALAVSIPLTIKRNKKAKKLLNQISDAKTGKEIFLEKTKNELEKERLKNKNTVLEKAELKLSLQEFMINNLKDEFEITRNNKDNNIDEVIILKKDKELELDILTTQNFLNKRFTNIRDKFNGFLNNTVKIVMPVTMITLTSIAFPYALIGQFHSFKMYHSGVTLITSILPVIAPLIASISGSYLYINNLEKKEIKVFRKLNSTLGKNSLAKKEENKEHKLTNELNSKIDELAELIILEKDIKRKKESTISTNNQKNIQYSVEQQLANLRPYFEEDIEDDVIIEEKGKKLIKR